MYQIIWSRKARKKLLKIDKKEAEIIYDNIGSLVYFPNCQHIRKLINHQFDYRMRIGRYRVLFNHQNDIKIISIEEIGKRDENTY